MANQADFDAKIARANAALENVTSEIAAQRQEIQDFIAAHPETDTSALDGVVARLESLGTDVDAIFEAPETGGETGGGETGGETGGEETGGETGEETVP